MSRTNSQHGFSLISILSVLLVAGLLYAGYLSLGGQASQNRPANVAATGKTVACSMNRLAIQNSIRTWSISHPGQPVSLKRLREDGVFIPECPEGGKLTLEGQVVHCSLHSD